jgi:hypothetical protein
MLQSHHTPVGTLASAAREGGGSTMIQMMAALGVLLLCFTMLTLLRRRLQKQAHSRGMTAQEKIRAVRERAQGRSSRAAPTSIATSAAKAAWHTVMAHAVDITRRLAALMDNKAAALEILIEQANAAAERLELARDSNATPPPPPTQKTYLPDPIAEEIYALADLGKTSLDIARALDEPTGKVELILALRQPAPAPSADAG